MEYDDKSPQGDFASSRCSFNCRRGARHVSLRAAAGGEAIPFSAAGDCFGGYAAAQQKNKPSHLGRLAIR